jgi:hypothetical protein
MDSSLEPHLAGQHITMPRVEAERLKRQCDAMRQHGYMPAHIARYAEATMRALVKTGVATVSADRPVALQDAPGSTQDGKTSLDVGLPQNEA